MGKQQFRTVRRFAIFFASAFLKICRYRRQSKDPLDNRYPKVFFTCREETIDQINNKDVSNPNPISCVRNFFPKEISNTDKDEDHECYRFLEQWCIQEFPEEGRKAFLNQYVVQNLRREFFKQIDFVPADSDLVLGSSKSQHSKSEILKRFLLDLQSESHGPITRGPPNPPLADASVLKLRQSNFQFAAAAIDVCSNFLGNLADDAVGEVVSDVLTGGRVIAVIKKLLSDANATPRSEADRIPLSTNDDLLCFAASLFTACFAFKSDQARQNQYFLDFLSTQRSLLNANQLWMPKSFDDAFFEMKELSELVKTPFMVQVLSKIMPRLEVMKRNYGFADAKKHLPRIHPLPKVGELWASHIIPYVSDVHFQQLANFNTPEDQRCNVGTEIFQKFVESFVKSVRKGTDIGDETKKSQSETALMALLLDREDQYRFLVDHFLPVQEMQKKQLQPYLAANYLPSPGPLTGFLARAGDKINSEIIKELIEKKVPSVRVTLASEDCRIVRQSEDYELYNAIFGRSLAAHVFSPSTPSAILAKAGDELTAELIALLHKEGVQMVPVAQKSWRDVYDDFGDSGETLGDVHIVLRDKIVHILTSPPLLRGVIYKVFCEYVVQENANRKHGGISSHSDVLLEAVHYSRNLALHLSSNSLSKLSRTSRSKLFAGTHESDKFFREDDLLSAARRTAPVKSGSEVSFLHKTLQEYFVAECLCNNLVEAFQVEQITPATFQKWISECNEPEWFSTADLARSAMPSPRSAMPSPRKGWGKALAEGDSASTAAKGAQQSTKTESSAISLDRLRRVLDCIEKCPLNHYEFGSDQEKVSVLDFFIDIMFINDSFVEILQALLALCRRNVQKNPENDKKEALNLQILASNLQHIVTQKISRLNGRCLMHEVLLQNNFVVFDFCTQVHESWSILNGLAGHTLTTTILNVVDDEGRPPVYYALENAGCLLLDNIAPEKTQALHASLVDKILSADVPNPKLEFETLAEAGVKVTKELMQVLLKAGHPKGTKIATNGDPIALSDEFDESLDRILAVDVLHPPLAKAGTRLGQSLVKELTDNDVKRVNIVDDGTKYCDLQRKNMLEMPGKSNKWGRSAWARYLENLHKRGFIEAQSMTPLVIEQYIKANILQDNAPKHDLQPSSKLQGFSAVDAETLAETGHDDQEHNLPDASKAEDRSDDAAAAVASASSNLQQQPIVIEIYIPAELDISRLKKPTTQGGYKLPEMKKFIDANRRLFNKESGPIKDDFPSLSSLSATECLRYISYILKLYVPPKPSAEVRRFCSQLVSSCIYVIQTNASYHEFVLLF